MKKKFSLFNSKFSIFNSQFSLFNSQFSIFTFQFSIFIFQFSIFQFSILTSCDDISCPLESTVECKMGFYAEAVIDGEGNMVPGAKIGIGDTLTISVVRQNQADSVLVNRLVGKSEAALPVSYYEPQDVIVFAFTDTLSRTARDTLWYEKDNVAHWDDPGCPVHYWHKITSLRFTRHLIDTVFINYSTINYDGRENFQICFRTGNE